MPTLAVVSLALTALFVGVLLYRIDRPAGSAWLVPAIPRLQATNAFGSAGTWQSSIVHPFGFSLLTAMMLPVAEGRSLKVVFARER